MTTFEALHRRYAWRPIAGCPGRFVLDVDGVALSALTSQPPLRCRFAGVRDAVDVVEFADGGGLLSYVRSDGTVLHTLNDVDGFARKRAALGPAIEQAA